MNPLSPQNKHNLAFGWICLVSCLLCCACMPKLIPQTGDFKAEPTRQNALDQYGFQASGFTPEQEKTVEKGLAAFGQALGGPEKLRRIIITFNHGEIRPILYDPQRIGAGSWIVLGPTSFSMELANRSNFSCYGAETDEQHTMIVLGHELSHLLVLAAERQTGVNWSAVYQQHVERDWARLGDLQGAEEEAVTQLSLKVLRMGYTYSLNEDTREIRTAIIYEVTVWTRDFLAALKAMP